MIRLVSTLNPYEGGSSFANSVRIPLPELPTRVHELPASHVPLDVITGPLDAAVTAALPGRSLTFVQGEPGEEGGRLWRGGYWAESLPPDSRTVLDLGCGSGRDAVLLASKGYAVTGVDHLPDALQRARLLARRYGVTVTERAEDVRNVQGECFDIALAAFLHIPHLAPLAIRVLKPGGILLVEGLSERHAADSGWPKHAVRVSDFSGFELLEAQETERHLRLRLANQLAS